MLNFNIKELKNYNMQMRKNHAMQEQEDQYMDIIFSTSNVDMFCLLTFQR